MPRHRRSTGRLFAGEHAGQAGSGLGVEAQRDAIAAFARAASPSLGTLRSTRRVVALARGFAASVRRAGSDHCATLRRSWRNTATSTSGVGCSRWRRCNQCWTADEVVE